MLKPSPELGSFILRSGLGVMFLAHGLLKLLVFSLPGTAAFFAQVGFPGFLAYPVVAAEVIGGILLILGVWPRLVALALVPVLLGALVTHLPNGWVFSAANGGWEYPAFLAIASLAYYFIGDGAYALKRTPETLA